MENFSDRQYLIIGASSGIGLALARKLAQAGAQVHTRSRMPAPEAISGVEWEAADVSAPDFQMHHLPETLHGLVYCPGSINLKPFNRISEEDFRKEMEINVVGAFKCIKAAMPALKNSGMASVVMFSTVAVQTGMNFHSSIAAAKGAVEGLTRALAAELAPLVRVNCIAPSLTDTPLAGKLLDTEEKRQNAAARHPLRRIGSPEDMAEAALFLLSENSRFMTGQILHIDGGLGTLR
ncbi:MAG: SDR family oxidoreductase [Bacteroidetes bacterium]|nr:SDR family oxidoreductase [Bacteroidota bacterium]